MGRRHFIIITSLLSILLFMFISNSCSKKQQSQTTLDLTCKEKALSYWEGAIRAPLDAIKEELRVSDSTYACIADVENEGTCYYIYSNIVKSKFGVGFGVFFPIAGVLSKDMVIKDENGEALSKAKDLNKWEEEMDKAIVGILQKVKDEDWAYISRD